MAKPRSESRPPGRLVSKSEPERRDGKLYMTGFVYILKDERHRYYIGSSKEPQKRFTRHLTGHVYTTRRMKNPRMVLCQEFDSISVARLVERRLKELKRKDYIDKIVQEGIIKMKV